MRGNTRPSTSWFKPGFPYAYNHKTWVDIERQGQPSTWVTLRACTGLRAAYG